MARTARRLVNLAKSKHCFLPTPIWMKWPFTKHVKSRQQLPLKAGHCKMLFWVIFHNILTLHVAQTSEDSWAKRRSWISTYQCTCTMSLICSFSSAWSRAGGFEQHALQNEERHAKTAKTIATNTTRSCRGWVSTSFWTICLPKWLYLSHIFVSLPIYIFIDSYTFGASFMNKLWMVNIICMSLYQILIYVPCAIYI